MQIVVPDNLLWLKYIYIYTYEKFTKIIKWQTAKEKSLPLELLNHLQCPTVQMAMHNSLNMILRNCALQSDETNISSCPTQPLHRSKNPHNPLSHCCSLIIQVNVLNHLDASCNESKLLSQLSWSSPCTQAHVLQFLHGQFSTRSLSMISWSWKFRNSQTSSAMNKLIYMLVSIYWDWVQLM
jgi:hypothetical protein